MADPNEIAKAALDAERVKFGFGKKSNHSDDSDDEEHKDMGDLEDEEESDEDDSDDKKADDSKDDDEDSDEDDADDSEDEDDEDESDDDTRKKIPKSYLEKEKAKRKKLKEKAAALEKELADSKSTIESLKAQIPDDMEAYIAKMSEDISKDLGITDPENFKKVLNAMREIAGKSDKAVQAKLDALEKKFNASSLNDEAKVQQEMFAKEWKGFESTIKAEFPSATDEQLEKVKELMDTLSHTDGIGGKSFKDADGKTILDPYPLDYIFFKNKNKFEELVDVKRRKGLESGRSQGATKADANTSKPLPKNASAQQIREREKEMQRLESEGGDNLRAPENSHI